MKGWKNVRIESGVIDGEKEINPDSQKEVWSSEDGIHWPQEKMKTERRGAS